MILRPIVEAPIDGTPILVCFDDNRKPHDRYCVAYFDQDVRLWLSIPGQRFTGHPNRFAPLP